MINNNAIHSTAPCARGNCARGKAGRGIAFTEEIKIRERNREVRLEKGPVGRVEHG